MFRILPLAALALVAGCHKPSAPAPKAQAATPLPAVKVEVATIESQKMPRFLTLTGSVLADRQSEVAANVSGRIAATYVERGQPVKQGQVIARVDSKAASFQAAAASAQSQAAETNVAQARQDCARADTLFSQGALAKAEYERQKTQCTAQLYSSNAARAQADLAGKLAGDTIIRSPLDGIIGERYVNIGEYVQPPSRVASVYAIDPVRVSISVPEQMVSQVKVGQAVALQVTGYPNRSFPAVIQLVSPTLRASTRDLIVEAFAPNADGALRPGMFATVRVVTGEQEQSTVPLEAIKVDGTVRRMFLAREGVAQELVVSTGVEKDGRIAVLEPLNAGDKVIVKPPAGLRDGAPISVN